MITETLESESDLTDPPEIPRALFVRLPAIFLSYVFHPVLIPLYVILFLVYWHPLVAAGSSELQKLFLLLSVFVNCTLLPSVSVFLMWRLKFIKSVFLKTQKERLIPYAAAMIFYFWCWYVLNNERNVPEEVKLFLLGNFIAVIVAWIANIYFKISIHSLAAGGMAFFITGIALSGEGSPGQYLTACWLILGLVCSARLVLGHHRPFEIYAGLLLGMLSQAVAMYF